MDFLDLSGALAIQHLRLLLREGHILNAQEERLQPSSLDLSISDEIYRMKGTFLPRPTERIRDILAEGVLFPTSLGQPLELSGIYLIRLNETLALPKNISAYMNNKSSSGRVNLQTRLLVDCASAFNTVPRGYAGELWLEVTPKSFPIKLQPGERLSQMRFFASDSRLTPDEYKRFSLEYGLLRNSLGEAIPLPPGQVRRGLSMSVDLVNGDVVGYRCIPTSGRLLTFAQHDHEPLDFFEPILKPKNHQVILRRGEFYIFATKEYIRIPIHFAAEMAPYDVSKGEFRSHSAGFFDPGFGYGKAGETLGTQGVLEIFTQDHDFVLRDGQPICEMIFEHLSEPAEVFYGDRSLTSHYQAQTGPRLSKHFRIS
jgi:dCTP deaminase